MKKKHTPVIAVDFDGVIHSYTSGWKGAHIIPDPPVEGAIRFLEYLMSDGTPATPVIFSTRAKSWRGRWAMRTWLCKHSGAAWDDCMGFQGIQSVPITANKPIASVYLDDRAVRFEGQFPELRHQVILDFVNRKPWNKS